jgi:hypothetical protein
VPRRHRHHRGLALLHNIGAASTHAKATALASALDEAGVVLLREDGERGRRRRRPESRKGEDSGAEAEEQGERGPPAGKRYEVRVQGAGWGY